MASLIRAAVRQRRSASMTITTRAERRPSRNSLRRRALGPPGCCGRPWNKPMCHRVAGQQVDSRRELGKLGPVATESQIVSCNSRHQARGRRIPGAGSFAAAQKSHTLRSFAVQPGPCSMRGKCGIRTRWQAFRFGAAAKARVAINLLRVGLLAIRSYRHFEDNHSLGRTPGGSNPEFGRVLNA
jgi:hypothetical protein